MERENILQRVRSAIGRTAGQAPQPAPEPWVRIPEVATEQRIEQLLANVRDLSGKTLRASSRQEALRYAEELVAGRAAVASNAPFLAECGVTALHGVSGGFLDREALRAACETADIGITSADYALADTGSLVMISSAEEARMISLLPPVHLAIVPANRVLTGLDELYSILPDPMSRSSAMVFITGPSRTADIEQILVRGVHGPGEIHVIVVE